MTTTATDKLSSTHSDGQPEDDPAVTSNRPADQAGTPAHRRIRPPKKTVRFTLDLKGETHRDLKLFSIQNSVEAAPVCRALIMLLMADPLLADQVLAIIDEERLARDTARDNDRTST